ncbi:hypothetical protein PAXRUDRAFT_158831 [Paxillus rubicundulus Ve08.2h10]|uniref:DUF8040 domain-containing protein n=1 Tax=Paxillus rubicundulus Ve08.2h10 TaxID=930991 RepID=A0A0D0D9F0_9AGAM|nr:hypothetical protein PAXRUDRAFT_158831 [Paxillus rubicundulus Ve08.2h10]
MHRKVFLQLISELRELGHANSKHVSLEEQLAIFLYMLVTGLTIRHVGEHFQRSNDTISLYDDPGLWLLFILSSQPLYTRYVQLPTGEFISSKINEQPQVLAVLQEHNQGN